MSRIHAAEQLDQTALEQADAQGRLELQTVAIYAHRPESREALWALMGSFGEQASGTLSPRLIELVRLRIAYWNQCRSCMSVRYQPDLVSQDTVCSLERPEDAPDLTDAEKAALRYADLMATDHLSIDDEVFDNLRAHFSEGEIVELGMFCAAAVGFGRLVATWHLTDHLHESFQGEQTQPFVPWGDGALR
ncbi:MAG TPA: hypothetical protein VMF55_01820 [Solirubrobacterales bacterium]|nr:hypothetical protein [Solirubrobacterales bacterium]